LGQGTSLLKIFLKNFYDGNAIGSYLIMKVKVKRIPGKICIIIVQYKKIDKIRRKKVSQGEPLSPIFMQLVSAYLKIDWLDQILFLIYLLEN